MDNYFEKNKCPVCNKKFSHGLTFEKHLRRAHSDFYSKLDNSIKNINERVVRFMLGPGKCKICGKDTKFNKTQNKYNEYCRKCAAKLPSRNLKISDAWKKKSKDELREINKKKEETVKRKYGITWNLDNPEIYNKWLNSIRNTVSKRRNDIIKKRENTCKRKYGVKNTFQLKDRVKEGMKKKYGVDHPLKVPEIKAKVTSKLNHEEVKRNIKTGGKSPKKMYNEKLHYQGSYEKDFLDYCSEIGILNLVDNGPSIQYVDLNGKKRWYFPDFIIGLTIIEIKSKWTLQQDKEINQKIKFSRLSGYDFLLILDKNYDEFNEKLQSIMSRVGSQEG